MQRTENSGWRAPPAVILATQEYDCVAKTELFECARLAELALALRPSSRFVLTQLVGCFREALKGRLLVWPSNELLMERTGLSERSVRYAVAELLSTGAVTARDSANGKRFAVRSRSGQIIDAYGIDLAPLMERRQEFQAIVDRIREKREARKRAFDEITICRRQAESMAEVIDLPADLEATIADAKASLPRRDSSADPTLALAEWRSILETVEQHYHAANGGKDCRIIENNNDAPDQSYSKGKEEDGARPDPVRLIDLTVACPDALSFADPIRNERELVQSAASIRGGFGVHESAWTEAVDKLGPVAAGAVFFLTLQHLCDDQKRKGSLRNYGGYFRSFMRRVAAGEVDLGIEIMAARRKRTH